MNDAATALLTEHFSYTPLSLIDDIINSINNLIYQAISSLESGLLSTPPERLGFSHDKNASTIPDTDADGNVQYPEAKLEIENGLHQLETLLEASVDKSFDKFEIYVLRNILTVPEDLVNWLRLDHYANLSLSNDPDAPTPESIDLLRRKLRETRKLQRALKHEYAQNEAILSQLRAVLSNVQQSATEVAGSAPQASETKANLDLSFLTNDPAAKMLNVGGGNALTTNTTFILSQLPALRAMVAQLRPKLQTLPTVNAIGNSEESIRRNERRAYIESRVRMHLERSGRALGEAAGVGTGRRVSKSEVEALETVSNLLQE
ncbi:hypothetical protein VTN49DRAFT_6863 [Thermomyces lanuginosus]|uniref:uncharacterized protein n=1 Tax=Thermomyces lanuginosus TaxID=5541 RepID=UPI0037438CB2